MNWFRELYNELVLNKRRVDKIYIIGVDAQWVNHDKLIVKTIDDKITRYSLFIESDMRQGCFRSYFPKKIMHPHKSTDLISIDAAQLKLYDEMSNTLLMGYMRKVTLTNYI